MSLLEKIKEIVEEGDRDATEKLAEKKGREFARSYVMADVIAGVFLGDTYGFPEMGVNYSDCTLSEWYNNKTQQYEKKCDYNATDHESEGATTITMEPHSDFIRRIMGSNISFDKRFERVFMACLAEELGDVGFDAYYSSDVQELVIHRVTTHCPDELKTKTTKSAAHFS